MWRACPVWSATTYKVCIYIHIYIHTYIYIYKYKLHDAKSKERAEVVYNTTSKEWRKICIKSHQIWKKLSDSFEERTQVYTRSFSGNGNSYSSVSPQEFLGHHCNATPQSSAKLRQPPFSTPRAKSFFPPRSSAWNNLPSRTFNMLNAQERKAVDGLELQHVMALICSDVYCLWTLWTTRQRGIPSGLWHL